MDWAALFVLGGAGTIAFGGILVLIGVTIG